MSTGASAACFARRVANSTGAAYYSPTNSTSSYFLTGSYVTETGGVEGTSLLPLFLSCRAAVRAKTSATAAGLESDAARRAGLQDLAGQYLSLAEELLEPPGPSLVAVGGLSGSGKSTLALALGPSIGPVPGALVIRSDEVRKRLHGVPPLTRLGESAYTADVSLRVYDTVADQARAAL